MADQVVLDPTEQRVLGALLEKQRTVPASYPLSLNALRTACNQSNSRDPVVAYDDRTVLDAIARLRGRDLAKTVVAGMGSRVLKYHQRLEEHLELAADERALITVLLLRGPQTPGELRTRTERLHTFADRSEVEAVLDRMAARTEPLVRSLQRRAGQQDARWIHLLGPVPQAEEAVGAAVPVVDRDVVIADGAEVRDRRIVAAYDDLAQTYGDRLADELDAKPFDRWLLDRVVELAAGGPVVDAGCGPGQVSAYLASRGAAATGVDVSAGMIEEARGRYPDIEFSVGDLRSLLRPRAAAGWSGVTAWYSLIHLAGSELPEAIAGLARVLVPGGWLALAVHLGDAVTRVTDMWGHEVELDFVFHDPADVIAAVRASGLVDVEWYQRGPYAGVEAETDRLYVLAHRPD